MFFLEILAKGGIVMIPIYLCSIIALVIFAERMLSLRRVRIDTRTFVLQVRNLLLKNQPEEAILMCKRTAGPIAKMARVAIENAKRPQMEVKSALDAAGKTEIYTLEKYMGSLATIASIAPMVGFFGTVTGMIRAFMEIQTRGGNVDPSVLAGGIWEALITTAAGLAVGIAALIFYNIIQSKVERIVFEMEEVSIEFLDSIRKETSERPHEFAN